MDRSFLSQPEVISASRSFVCVRVATYEDKDEAKLLKSIFVGFSGDLENTTFAIMDPDATRLLVRPGRSPDFAFGRGEDAATRMASTMRQISEYYKVKGSGPAEGAPLPENGDPRLALNVASCDNLPLVVLKASSAEARTKLEKTLAPLSWSKELIGKAIYSVQQAPSLKLKLDHAPKAEAGLVVIAPDKFGQSGKILAELPVTSDTEQVKRELLAAVKKYAPVAKDSRSHIFEGDQLGVYWQTLLPVTDRLGPQRTPPPGVSPTRPAQ